MIYHAMFYAFIYINLSSSHKKKNFSFYLHVHLIDEDIEAQSK